MPLPDPAVLTEAGGWVVAIMVLLGVLGALATGILVAGPTHNREVKRADALDNRLDTLVETVREQTSHLRTLLALQGRRDGPG